MEGEDQDVMYGHLRRALGGKVGRSRYPVIVKPGNNNKLMLMPRKEIHVEWMFKTAKDGWRGFDPENFMLMCLDPKDMIVMAKALIDGDTSTTLFSNALSPMERMRIGCRQAQNLRPVIEVPDAKPAKPLTEAFDLAFAEQEDRKRVAKKRDFDEGYGQGIILEGQQLETISGKKLLAGQG